MCITKLKKFFILFILINGSLVLNLQGQIVSPSFKHYIVEDGLPSSEVYNAIQDRKGNIWFGTDRGVARYDGYEFRIFTYNDGLIDNTVFKLSEDKNGRIWMLTYSGRVFFFENDKIYPYKYNDILFDKIQNRVPYGFYVDSLENIFITILVYGQIKISNKGEIENLYTVSNKPGVNYHINELSHDKLLTSILSADIKVRKIKIIVSNNSELDSISFLTNAATRFEAIRLSNNKILFSIGKSLYLRTNDSLHFLYDLPGTVYSLLKDSKQNIWVGTVNGVFLFNQDNLKNPLNHFLEHNNVTCILEDHEGGFWFTTLNNGVYYMSGYGIKGILFNQGLFQKPTSLATDFLSSVYVGCWNGTLVQVKGGKTKIVYYPGKGTNFILTNLTNFPKDDKIYLSRSQPGYFYKEKFIAFKTSNYMGIKTNFFKRSNGDLYCAGTQYIFINKIDSIIPYAVISQRISCLAETRNKGLLLGSNLGVFEFDDYTKETTIFRKEFSSFDRRRSRF